MYHVLHTHDTISYPDTAKILTTEIVLALVWLILPSEDMGYMCIKSENLHTLFPYGSKFVPPPTHPCLDLLLHIFCHPFFKRSNLLHQQPRFSNPSVMDKSREVTSRHGWWINLLSEAFSHNWQDLHLSWLFLCIYSWWENQVLTVTLLLLYWNLYGNCRHNIKEPLLNFPFPQMVHSIQKKKKKKKINITELFPSIQTV